MSEVTEWSSKKPTKTRSDTEEWRGRKFGHLTVIGEHKKKTHFAHIMQILTCMCDCGRVKDISKTMVLYRGQRTCESVDCWYWQKEPARLLNPAIVIRLKPKYICQHPAAECTISSLCKICCHECDRHCKSCLNTPDKCGAKLRPLKNK